MKRSVKKKMIPLAKGFWNIAVRDLLLLLLLLVCGVNEVSGANGAVGGTFEYQGNTYEITDLNATGSIPYCTLKSSKVSNDEPLIVPDYAYNSETEKLYMVTAIAANSCDSYRGSKVVIGNNVKTIGEKAFEHFGEHESSTLILGKNVRTIEDKAFEHFGEHKSGSKVFITSRSMPKNMSLRPKSFEHVENTTFYLANEYLYNKYKANNDWRVFDADNNNKGNSYSYPYPYEYDFNKGWKTFIGPEDMENYYIESIFGHGTKVAYLKEAQWISAENTYNLTFAETTAIKANTPYFINPTNDNIVYFSEAKCVVNDNNCTSVAVEGKDGYYAKMIGNASDEDSYLKKNEFYFRNYQGLHFYVAGEDSKNFVSPGKCHFRITEGTNDDTPVLAKVAMFMDFDDDTPTGITEVETSIKSPKGIYDIHGMYRGNNLQSLPKGLYIVNGKKIIK